MEILSCKDLKFRYNGSSKDTLSGVSFAVQPSQVVLLVGRTGSGKSTLLRLLKKEIAPVGEVSGEIKICGKAQGELSLLESTQCISYVSQNPDTQTVTHKVSVRRFDYLKANESMRRQMQQLGVGEELLALYENHRWLNLVDVYMFYHVHGRELSPADRHHGLQELHRVWLTIDRPLLDVATTAKFGYRPCRCWTLFRLQEWLYFTLRGLLGRNR